MPSAATPSHAAPRRGAVLRLIARFTQPWAMRVHTVVLAFLGFGAAAAWFSSPGWALITALGGVLGPAVSPILGRRETEPLSKWIGEIKKFRGAILFVGYALTIGVLVAGLGVRVWPHRVSGEFVWVTAVPRGVALADGSKRCSDAASCVLLSGQSGELRFKNSHRNYDRVSVSFDVTSPDDVSGSCTPTKLRLAYTDTPAESIGSIQTDRQTLPIDLREDRNGRPVAFIVKVDPDGSSKNCQFIIRVDHARLSLGKWFI